MEDEKARDIGLFRYSLAREAADPRLSKNERGAIVRALADGRAHRPGREPGPRVGRSTIDHWVRELRTGWLRCARPDSAHRCGAHRRRGARPRRGAQARGAGTDRRPGRKDHGERPG